MPGWPSRRRLTRSRLPGPPGFFITRRTIGAAHLLAVLIATATAAAAQGAAPAHRREIGFAAGASAGEGGAALASALDLAVSLSPRFGIAVELAHARTLDFTLDLCPPPRLCIRGGRLPVTGRAVSLVPHVRTELLGVRHKVRVHVQAGIGAGHVRQRWLDSPSPPSPIESTRSSLTTAISLGGGIVLPVSDRISIGAELRSLHLFDKDATPDRAIEPSGRLGTLRIGARVGWRF